MPLATDIMLSKCSQSPILLTLDSLGRSGHPGKLKGQDLAGSWLRRHKTKRRFGTARKRQPTSTRIEPRDACTVGTNDVVSGKPARPRRHTGARTRLNLHLEQVAFGLNRNRPCALGGEARRTRAPPEASAGQFFGWSFWVSPPGASVAGAAPGVAAPSVPGAGVAPGAAPASVPAAGAVAVMIRV